MRPGVSALPAYAAATGLAAAPVRLAAQALPDTVWSVSTPDRVAALAVSPDGHMVAVGMWGGTIRLLRASDGAQVTDLRAYVRSLPHYVRKGGLPIVFSVDGTEVGTETTNAAGRAFLLYVVPPDAAIGDHPFTCSFAGNAAYEPTEQGGLLTVMPQ